MKPTALDLQGSPDGSPRWTRRRAVGALGGLLCAAAGAARAQGYPSKSVTIIMNFPPGQGAMNTMVRSIADDATKDLKHPVVVDYRAGAGGNIGAQAVATAPADGYTLLAAVDTTLTVNPAVYATMPFDADKSFTPVATLATFSQLLVVNPKVLPVKNFAEFVAYAKTKPLHYASAGNGSPGHVATEMLASTAGLKLEHVPYKGNAPATQALLAGDVAIGFLVSSGVLPHVEAGKLVALASSSVKRSAVLPNLPTVAEMGYPGFAADFAWVLMAPAGTPEPIVKFSNAQVQKTLARDDLQPRLHEWDVVRSTLSPVETGERLRTERKRWAEVVKRAGIQGS